MAEDICDQEIAEVKANDIADEDFLTFEDDESVYIFVAILDGKIVGTIQANAIYTTLGLDSYYVMNFNVLKEYRRTGVGTRLMDTVIDLADGKQIFLSSKNIPSRKAAHAFYKKMRFEGTSHTHYIYDNGFDFFI